MSLNPEGILESRCLFTFGLCLVFRVAGGSLSIPTVSIQRLRRSLKGESMKNGLLVLCSFLFILVASVDAVVVNIPDPNLEAAIRNQLGIPTDPLTDADLANITTLDAASQSIADLTGLEFCVNILELGLNSNQVSDISPLSGLTTLQKLGLNANQLTDISALSNLINLSEMDLGSNQISDVGPLSGLTGMTRLGLTYNQISNVGPLSGLTNLTELGLTGNQISDIGTLSSLTGLRKLGLESNQISDIGPLSSLTSLLALTVSSNQISSISALANLTNLMYLGISSNQISDISALSGLFSIVSIGMVSNQITDLQPLVDNPGLGSGDSVDVQFNPLSTTSLTEHIPTLQSRGVSVTYTEGAVPVELVSFTATVVPKGVRIEWGTASETNHLGFHVYRSQTKDGDYIRITSAIIKGNGTDSTPHDYSFIDEGAEVGNTYWYLLEDVAFDGATKRLESIRVTIQEALILKNKLATLWGKMKQRTK